MSTRFSKWTIAALTGFISCNSLAEIIGVEDDSTGVISISVGSSDTSGAYGASAGGAVSEVDLDYASGPGVSLGWGIQDGNSRFLLEYYRADVEIESPPFAVAGGTPELQIQSLFYSGYWLPDIYWGLRGILGAGIGYSEQTLDNARLGELSDRGWSMKASVGLEFALAKSFSVYALAEGISYGDVADRVSFSGVGNAAGGTTNRSLTDSQQLRVALGINLRYW